MLHVSVDIEKTLLGQLYDVQPNHLFIDEPPALVLPPAIHKVPGTQTASIFFVSINLCIESIYIEKGEIFGLLEETNVKVSGITTGTVYEVTHQDVGYCFDIMCHNKDDSSGKKLKTSPADIDVHHNANL